MAMSDDAATNTVGSSLKTGLDVAASVAMIATAGILLWSALGVRAARDPSAAIALPTEAIALERTPMVGQSEARGVMIVLSDFECPFCRRFALETMPTLKRNLVDSGLARLGFMHMPLRIHQDAEAAAVSAECAGEQGKFWTVHDALFAPPQIQVNQVQQEIAKLGLKKDLFDECVEKGGSGVVKADQELAQRLNVTSTPSVLLGLSDGTGVRLKKAVVGARSPEEFEAALREILDQ